MKRLAVLILNYNNREYLEACLDALAQGLRGISHDTWFLDNTSTDGSTAWVREYYPDVRVLENPKNKGFPHGNNRGLERMGIGGTPNSASLGHEYVLLLNPAIEVEKAALQRMLSYMDTHLQVSSTA